MDIDRLMAIARDVSHTSLDPADIFLTDLAAVVTGGGGGIGQGVALGLARFGADVAVLDVVPERAAATADAVRSLGRTSIGLPCDVTSTDQLRQAISDAHRGLGRIDILVNNAGGIRPGPFLTQPEASMRRHIELNLVSMLVATQEAATRMVEAGRGGSIVNVASIEGHRAAPGFAVYGACKAGMLSFTRTMAVELAEHGIRVNCICPDRIITPGLRGNLSGPVDPEMWADPSPAHAVSVPAGREGLVDECAGAVVWLCSKMAAYVTGVNLPVDGGTWAAGGWVRDGKGGWTVSP